MFFKSYGATLYFNNINEKVEYNHENILRYSAFHGDAVKVRDQFIPATKPLRKMLKKYDHKNIWSLYSKIEKQLLNEYFNDLSLKLTFLDFEEYSKSFIESAFTEEHSRVFLKQSLPYGAEFISSTELFSDKHKYIFQGKKRNSRMLINIKMSPHAELLYNKIMADEEIGENAGLLLNEVTDLFMSQIVIDGDSGYSPDYYLYYLYKNFTVKKLEELVLYIVEEQKNHTPIEVLQKIVEESNQPLEWIFELNSD